MEHDHMIEALAPNGTNHPLHVGSLPRHNPGVRKVRLWYRLGGNALTIFDDLFMA